MLTKIFGSLQAPAALSWPQLAAATVVVLTVALLWRQVTLFIMREI